MSGHFELGEILKNHKDSDIGKLLCQTVSSEEATKCYNQFPTSAFLCIFLNLSYICPYNLPFFPPNNLPPPPFHPVTSNPALPHFLLLLTSYSITSEPSRINHTHPSSVPFLESPKYVPKRKESAHTLPLPSLHSHPLLRANSDNTMTQSDPLPNKAATNPNPGQVLRTIRCMLIC